MSDTFTPKDLYDLPMKAMRIDTDPNPRDPKALGWGRATKNGKQVEVLVMTCKNKQLTAKAYVMLLALLNGEIQ